METIIEIEFKGKEIVVVQVDGGAHYIKVNGEDKHGACTSHDVIRALGFYMHDESVTKAKETTGLVGKTVIINDSYPDEWVRGVETKIIRYDESFDPHPFRSEAAGPLKRSEFDVKE